MEKLFQMLKELADKIRSLNESAEGREFTAEESKRWDGLCEEYDSTKRKLQREKMPGEIAELETWLAKPVVDESEFRDSNVEYPPSGCTGEGYLNRNTATGGIFRNEATGQEVRARRHGEPIATRGATLDVGRCITSLLTGRIEDLPKAERSAMMGASQTGGGYMLNPMLSTQIVDLARAASVTMRAGALTLPMETGELNLVRVASDPTGVWRPETSAIAASSVGFERVTLSAKTLACLVPISIELAEDASNASQTVAQVIQRALAVALDQAVLCGSGAQSEPRGIVNQSGINAITDVGAVTDWSNPSKAVGDILGANYPGEISALSWVQTPTIAEAYDGLVESSTGAPLQPTPWTSQLKRFYTTSMPTGTDVVGDFSQVLVGMRTSGVVVQLLDAGTATDGDGTTWNATSQMLRWIRCYMRADVAIMKPSFFTVSSGLTQSE